MNAEYLIGIGDAQAKLGNKAEAKKSYEAYLADPLALPGNVAKVKVKLARLEGPSDALALPGPGLTLPGSAPATPARKMDAPLPLPGLDAPEAAPAQSASAGRSAPPPLPLPGIAPAKQEPEKIASAAPPLPLPLPGLTAKADGSARKDAAPGVASKEPAKPAKPIAVVTPERPVDRRRPPQSSRCPCHGSVLRRAASSARWRT